VELFEAGKSDVR